MSNCLCLPSVRRRDSLFQSRLEIGFHQIEQSSASRFLFLLFLLIVLPSIFRFFFWQLLLSGLFAIWPTSVKKKKKNSTDCCPSRKISRCMRLQYVVLPKWSVRLFYLSGVYLWIFFGGFSVWSKHQL